MENYWKNEFYRLMLLGYNEFDAKTKIEKRKLQYEKVSAEMLPILCNYLMEA